MAEQRDKVNCRIYFWIVNNIHWGVAMKALLERKWIIVLIISIIILLIINNVYLYKQNTELKNEAIDNMKDEWYQVYRLTENMDKYYIKNNFKDPEKFRWYVSQTCQHFRMTGKPNELTVNMGDLLIQAYDQLYSDLTNTEETLNKEKATQIFTGINQELMSISKDILDMQDNDRKKLVDTSSSEFIDMNIRVKKAAEKYIKMVDDYYREK